MKIVDIADQIYKNLDHPEHTSVSGITFWIRSDGVGELNNLLLTNLSINDSTLEFNNDLNDAQYSVLQKLYEIYNYARVVRQNLGASAFNSVLETSSDGASVKFINKNSISLTYIQLKKEASLELQKLINGYKQGNHNIKSVNGNDYIEGCRENQSSLNNTAYRNHNNFLD